MTAEEFIKNYGYQKALKAHTKDAVKISDFENYARKLTENERYWNDIQLVYTFHPAIDEVEGKKQIASIVADYGIGIVTAMASQAKEAKERDDEMQRLTQNRDNLRDHLAELNAEIELTKQRLGNTNDLIQEIKDINLYVKLDWNL